MMPYRTTRSCICSAADIVPPKSYRNLRGPCLGTSKAVGRGRRRYANTFMTASSSDITMPEMTALRRKDIKSVSTYAIHRDCRYFRHVYGATTQKSTIERDVVACSDLQCMNIPAHHSPMDDASEGEAANSRKGGDLC